MLAKFVPHARKLLAGLNEPVVFVDIGSRNGVLELREIADGVDAYGFEPNPAEYQKLVTGQTDLAKKEGTRPPKYHKLSYAPYAIFSECGQHEFYVTRGPAACGLHEPNIERLREIKWKSKLYQKSFGDEVFPIVKKIPMEVRTVDWFCKERALDHIDYLKIDVEGAEYDVLSGAANMLAMVGVIKVEVCFIPFRKNQKLFSDVDLLLRRHGFDLLRYEIDPGQVGYKERLFPCHYGPSMGFPDPGGQPLSCDAIYVNRDLTDKKRLIAQAVVLIEKNYLDEALFILKNKVNLHDESLLELLRTYQGRPIFRAARAAVQMMRWLKNKVAIA